MAHRVLVVDDDQAIHALARESLSNWFTHCIAAYDGQTAVRFASEQKPDAILLDMNMPGLNGFEVCRQLKWNTQTQDIPVIFLTSRTDMADKIKGMGMGAVDNSARSTSINRPSPVCCRNMSPACPSRSAQFAPACWAGT